MAHWVVVRFPSLNPTEGSEVVMPPSSSSSRLESRHRYSRQYDVESFPTDSRDLGRHQRGRSSDPDLSRYTRRSVTDAVRQELGAHLDPFLTAIENKIHATLELHKLPPRPTVAKEQPLEEHVQKLAAQEAQIIELSNSLQQLRSEKEEVDRNFQRTINEKGLIAQKLRSSEVKAQKLQALILESGLAPSGPDDEEVQKRFERLRYNILQIVKKHCTNHNASKEPGYARLSDEAKDFWVMFVITKSLYHHCFSDQRVYFGFDHVSDGHLNEFYKQAGSQSTVSEEDKKEWRVRTCLLGMSWDGQGAYRRMRAQDLAAIICKKLTVYIPNAGWFAGVTDKSSVTAEVKALLVPICDEALKLAQVFNSNKTEYMWANRKTELDHDHVEVLGSAGYRSFAESKDDYIVIFGGVCKGGGLQGKLADGIVHLTDTEVVLGPI